MDINKNLRIYQVVTKSPFYLDNLNLQFKNENRKERLLNRLRMTNSIQKTKKIH